MKFNLEIYLHRRQKREEAEEVRTVSLSEKGFSEFFSGRVFFGEIMFVPSSVVSSFSLLLSEVCSQEAKV